MMNDTQEKIEERKHTWRHQRAPQCVCVTSKVQSVTMKLGVDDGQVGAKIRE